MQSNSSLAILARYKIAAKALAKSNGIEVNKEFENNLNKLFDTNQIKLDLNKEFRGRIFKATTKAASLAAAAQLAFTGFTGFVSTVTAGVSAAEQKQTTSGYVEQNPDYDNQYPDFAKENTDAVVETTTQAENTNSELPISNSININDYSDAGKDFMQKLSEIYKYNTGEEIDLSSLGVKNIGFAETTIYTATIGNETYKFSGMSSDASNNTYLENALTSLGGDVTKSNGSIVYITSDGEQSIAICDSMGNPIKSGNVMGPGGMYNPKFIASAKEDLEMNGIDTDGITEEQFIGYWLCYNDVQNENLSKSISPIFSLAKYMNDHFRTDKADPYTVQLYSQMSEEIGNDFNNSAANKDSQTYDDAYTADYDNDER